MIEKRNVCKVISVFWDDFSNTWSINIDDPNRISIKKNVFEITLKRKDKRIFIHESSFDFLKLFYPVEGERDYLTDILWGASTLESAIFFVESENDILNGLCYFYRNLKIMERREVLKGNRWQYLSKRVGFSHGLYLDIKGNKK